ncbi:GDSL-type esterase/lipase family protein [Kribbella sp. CA-245084]|uniref:GDSL-type esterase/lipase family protein n=1 Tax=Kribbella sp. CA-245084 TaxID=3239940 RepID=UPI003D91563E
MDAVLQEVSLDLMRNSVRGAVVTRATAGGFQACRLPAWAYGQFPDQGITNMSQQASGVRLEFETAAELIEFDVHLTRPLAAGLNLTARPPIFAAVVAGVAVHSVTVLGGTVIWLDSGRQQEVRGGPSRVSLSLGGNSTRSRSVQVWLPHTAWVEMRAFSASAPVVPAQSSGRVRWVHHGSSISHCGDADGPLGTWPAIAARGLDFDLTNLGFGGNAMLDPFTARTIRDLPAELITIKVGINIVNGDAMSRRTFVPALHGFLDTVREGHPRTPVVVISPISCPIHENTVGPTEADPDAKGLLRARPRSDGANRLTLGAVRDAVTEVLGRRCGDDDRLHYLDGRRLLGESDSHHLHDRLNPDAAGYRLMGERFVALAGDGASELATAISDSRRHVA